MAVMGSRGIRTFSRALRYRNQTISFSDGTLAVTLVGQEKGVDVRIALDIACFALEGNFDVALILSQDQDLFEAVQNVKKISMLQNRWIKPACAFPTSPTVQKTRGINGTDWIRIDRANLRRLHRSERLQTQEGNSVTIYRGNYQTLRASLAPAPRPGPPRAILQTRHLS